MLSILWSVDGSAFFMNYVVPVVVLFSRVSEEKNAQYLQYNQRIHRHCQEVCSRLSRYLPKSLEISMFYLFFYLQPTEA